MKLLNVSHGKIGRTPQLKIPAPSVDNKANAYFPDGFTTFVGVPKFSVKSILGEVARQKTVAISRVSIPWQILDKTITK